MKVFVAGHEGMVGSALVRAIEQDGTHSWIGKPRQELDLADQSETLRFVAEEKPDAVVLAAAKVGGILANIDDPTSFLFENLKIQMSVIEAARKAEVKKFIFLGSSCIYPASAQQPIAESELLSGRLEPSNQSYALAKISGVQMVTNLRQQFNLDWFSLMPTNLYGPNDNHNLATSHVIPALVDKAIMAKNSQAGVLNVWGTGRPLREFLHVDDLASAILLLLNHEDVPYPIMNIGSGYEVSIGDLASKIALHVGFNGSIIFDNTKPDGVSRKLLDSDRVRSLGWKPSISLDEGLEQHVLTRVSELGLEI